MDDQLDFGKDIVLTTSDEDEDSEAEDVAAERRRRFCIERKQMGSGGGSEGALKQPKRSREEYDRINSSNKRRRMVNNEQRHQPRQANSFEVGSHSTTPSSVRSPMNLEEHQQQPKGPVIYINPKFIKKFIEKSIKLASNNDSQTKQQQQQQPKATTTTAATASSTATSMIEEIDFKTTSRDSLKAASTMAIIRIVTECIEDAGKRDEKLNKFLVSRLIYTLIQPEETTISSGKSSNSMNRNHDSSISTGSGSGGQPIPVIGGSVNQFNTCLLGVDGAPYSKPKRYQDSRKNKVKNHS